MALYSRVQLVWYVDMNAPPKKSTASYVYCNTVHIDTTGTEVQQSVSQSVIYHIIFISHHIISLTERVIYN